MGSTFGYLHISGSCFVLLEDKKGLQLKLEHAGSELNRNFWGGGGCTSCWKNTFFLYHTKQTQRKNNGSTSFAIDNMYYINFRIQEQDSVL